MMAFIFNHLKKMTFAQSVVALFLGLCVFPVWFRFFPFCCEVPLLDVRSFSPSLLGGVLYGCLLVALFVFYGRAYFHSEQIDKPISWFLGVTALFGLPLLFTYPINANDVYRYFIRGRIMAIYGENPYLLAPIDFQADKFFPFGGEWVAYTTPYGPLWELMAGGIGWLAQDRLWLGLMGFKLVALVCHLLVGWLVWCVGGEAVGRVRRTILWLWNPAILLMFVVDAHNDALMMLWLALGYLLWQRDKPILGFLVMCLAPLSKPIGVLPLPFFFVAYLVSGEHWRTKLRFALSTILGGLALLWLSFLPFGSPLYLAERLMAESLESAGFSVAILLFLFEGQGSLAWLLLINRVGTVLFAIVFFALLILVWRGRRAVRAAADVFFGYFATALTFRIWYPIWPFLWMLFDDENGVNVLKDARLAGGLAFLFITQISILVYNHLHNYVLGGIHLYSHLIGVPLVFGVPLWVWWRMKRRAS